MTKVKICGITNLEDALHAVECGADMLGFNFYRGSKRYVEPATAGEIVAGLNGLEVEKVGVFVNAEIAEIAEIAERVGLDAIQLHGDEDPGYVSRLRSDRSVVKAIRPRSFEEACYGLDFDCDAVLVDGFSDTEYGGSGVNANWEHAQAIWGMVPMLYLAGGLTPDNVAAAIRTVEPYAVDVASGVESSPGKKDSAKVAAFIKAAKGAL